MRTATTSRLLSLATQAVGHGVGVAVVYAASFWPMGPQAASLLGEAAAAGAVETLTPQFALQLGLSGCFWALLMIAIALVRVAARSRRQVKTVKLSRGVVLTETLIVMPIFLLLTLGLSQLTLNNTAAILTGLAAFQAGRTVHLWAPETNTAKARNGGQSQADVEERARVAAASVLAPMQPTSFADGCSTSALMERKIEAMMSVSLGTAGSFGFSSAGAVRAAALAKDASLRRNLSVNRAFDTETFEVRGPLKLLGAYCNTDAAYVNGNGTNVNGADTHRVAISFDYKQTMPLVGPIFGTTLKPTGRFSRIQRTYEIPRQISPNPITPTSVLAFLPSQIGSPFSGWF